MSGIEDISVILAEALINGARRERENAEQLRQRRWLAENASNAANARFERLNQALNREIAGLNDEMRNMANEQNRRLNEQARNFNEAITSLKVNLEAAINDVQASLQAKESNHRRQADFWISQANIFFTDIEQYRHDLFTPNQLQKLKNQLAQASSDMQSEAFQSAIASARGVFNKTAELREIVVNAEIEWNFYYKKFQEALADATSDLNYRKAMQFTFATEEGDETLDANINYWTENALDGIEEKLTQITQRAAKPDELSTDALKEMLEEFKQINAEMEVLENKAKAALVSSQFRAEIASKLGEALISQGWTCDGSAYEGGEYNGKVHVKMSDIKGNEIVAVIAPDENLANNIELNFFNKDNDEGFRKTHLGNILNSLKEGGLNIGKSVCRKGYERRISDNEAIRDIKATAAKKA